MKAIAKRLRRLEERNWTAAGNSAPESRAAAMWVAADVRLSVYPNCGARALLKILMAARQRVCRQLE